mmetsp:Transcript_52119/g.167722  ORF Transcript_52119/g.167722 Transcript_52119/m.167722 type:complete len:202 (+) Transcript_52119:157-762(+)
MQAGIVSASQLSCICHAHNPGTTPTMTATLNAPLTTFTSPKFLTTKVVAMTVTTMTVATVSVGPESNLTKVCAPWLCRSLPSRKSTRSCVRMCAAADSGSGVKASERVTRCRSARGPSPITRRAPQVMPLTKLMWRHPSPTTAPVTSTGSSSKTTSFTTAHSRQRPSTKIRASFSKPRVSATGNVTSPVLLWTCMSSTKSV